MLTKVIVRVYEGLPLYVPLFCCFFVTSIVLFNYRFFSPAQLHERIKIRLHYVRVEKFREKYKS